MIVAVVGATGMVGEIMRTVLEERNFPITEFLPVASERSVGKTISFQGKDYTVIGLEDAVKRVPDFALFSAGGQTSLDWAPKFAAVGTTVIDNSSAWRMHPDHKLIVPEINADQLTADDKIIANPNCSTIQMVMALAPIHKRYGIERVVVSTYQSITGTGVKAVQQLEDEYAGIDGEKAYPHDIHRNALPHCDVFLDNGYTKEEMKLVNETHKILDPSIQVTATAVRIPVVGGHSEAVNLTLSKTPDLEDIRDLLNNTPGVVVVDNLQNNEYPMPLNAEGKDEVFVGRIRKDESQDKGINLWIVADNLRKGAATNTVQIAEYLMRNVEAI
ncbi:MAG: aspartate-semialdehyde dehydrogenase [Flavobacteriaceae bacterium]|jgi:aspartate-semialdehyde dehydrogenase|nr:aspartate-semialdehyde dehydrogenase [Flavobacteriaceae bacterium]